MRDLSTWTGAPAPTGLDIEGRTVALEIYDHDRHLEDLWAALGGRDLNQLIRFFPVSDFETSADFGRWLDGAQGPDGYITEVFRSRETGAVVGMGSFMRPDPKNGVIEIGSIAHGPAMARSPMATEAHYLLARHVFETLGYRRYEWKCHNENGPSKVAAERYGFTFEGVFRQHMISRGANRDTAWFSMIDSEWPGLKAAFETWLDPANFDAEGRQRRRLEDIRAALKA